MKKVFGIRALASMLVLCFLCGCVLSRAAQSVDPTFEDESDVPLTGDTQVPDEEQGEEIGERDFTNDDKSYRYQGNLFLVCTIIPSEITTAIHSNLLHTADLITGSTSYDVPIYLVNKRLRI
jgi:hypothetical protein